MEGLCTRLAGLARQPKPRHASAVSRNSWSSKPPDRRRDEAVSARHVIDVDLRRKPLGGRLQAQDRVAGSFDPRRQATQLGLGSGTSRLARSGKAEPDSIDPRPHARLEGQIDTGVAVEGPDGRSVDADRQAFARLAAVDVKLAAADGARFGGRDGRGGRSLPGPRSRNGEREQDDRTWKSKYRLHGNPPRLVAEKDSRRTP